MAYTQQNLYFTLTSPLGQDKLLFKRLNGEERLSDLFFINLEMLSESDDLAFDSIVGKRIGVTVKFAADHQRYFHGVVSRFMRAGTDARFTVYYAELRPWLWLLTLTRNCRIFQNKTVPEIIKQIFDDAGFTDYKDSLTGTYTAREYCVQYEESDFNFVSRLMEDEGIYYYFEHEAAKHTLVLIDDIATHVDCPGIATARFINADNDTQPEDAIVSCTWSQQVTPGKYAVDDFNFETPSVDLLVSATGKTGSQRIYEYGPNFLKTADGQKIANRRIEAHEWNNKLLEGQGHCFSFIAGYKFTLAEHPSTTLNQAYVLYSVAHSLTFNSYSNAFQAVPADGVFRPPLITPRPRIHSTQTAIVTGKSGEEIWTDKYGRIKVQFHWDQEGKKDENTTCWIRVNQSWAGKAWGNLWLPRIGQEVIVSFINGDPDRPLVTGGVYNAEQTVPYGLPDNKTKGTLKSHSTKQATGFNEMRFEDLKDSEEFFMHAQKDMNIVVLNNQTSTIKKNRTVTVEEEHDTLTVSKGNRTTTINQARTTTVQEKDDTLKVEKGSRIETIKTDHKVTVQSGDRVIKVETGAETHNVKKDYTIKVEGNLSIDVTGTITIKAGKSISLQAGTSVSAKAGTSFANEAGTSFSSKAGTSLTNEAGTSLTNKAGTSLTNEAQISLTNKANASLENKASGTMTHKASGMQTLEASGITMVKGALVKIN
jgi:type VI secretion system secreted protein VgrG